MKWLGLTFPWKPKNHLGEFQAQEIFEHQERWNMDEFGKWFMSNYPFKNKSGTLSIQSYEVETGDHDWPSSNK